MDMKTWIIPTKGNDFKKVMDFEPFIPITTKYHVMLMKTETDLVIYDVSLGNTNHSHIHKLITKIELNKLKEMINKQIEIKTCYKHINECECKDPIIESCSLHQKQINITCEGCSEYVEECICGEEICECTWCMKCHFHMNDCRCTCNRCYNDNDYGRCNCEEPRPLKFKQKIKVDDE